MSFRADSHFLTYSKRVIQGWFTNDNQSVPTCQPNYLSKVESVPESIVHRIETQLSSSRNSEDALETAVKTRKVVLAAVYARVLRRRSHDEPIDEMVLSSSSTKVTRSDLVKLILEQVGGHSSMNSHSELTHS